MPNYAHSAHESYFRSLPTTISSGTAISVSTLTPLTSWVSVTNFVKMLFALQNTDVTNEVSLIVETSQDAVHVDAVFWQATAPAGEQVAYEIGPKEMRQYYRMSAQTDSPGFPTVAVNWQMQGIPRA